MKQCALFRGPEASKSMFHISLDYSVSWSPGIHFQRGNCLREQWVNRRMVQGGPSQGDIVYYIHFWENSWKREEFTGVGWGVLWRLH